jgi:hypothetical protein
VIARAIITSERRRQLGAVAGPSERGIARERGRASGAGPRCLGQGELGRSAWPFFFFFF